MCQGRLYLFLSALINLNKNVIFLNGSEIILVFAGFKLNLITVAKFLQLCKCTLLICDTAKK